MREILFRGKRIDNGEWVYGFYVHDKEWARHYIYFPKHIGGFYQIVRVKVEEKSVGQFIGLKDKNGKEIYEGDIDKSGDAILWSSKLSLFCTHSFYSYMNEFKPSSYPIDVSRIEIIGNMYEHKHLFTAIA